MRKVLFVLVLSLLLLPVCGCNETVKSETAVLADIPPIEKQIKTVPDEWKGAYGDTDKTQIYYNIALAEAAIDQHSVIINKQAAVIAQLAVDVNDLRERIAVLDPQHGGVDIETLDGNSTETITLNTGRRNPVLTGRTNE